MSPSPLDILPKKNVPLHLVSDMKCGKRTKKKNQDFWRPLNPKNKSRILPNWNIRQKGYTLNEINKYMINSCV